MRSRSKHFSATDRIRDFGFAHLAECCLLVILLLVLSGCALTQPAAPESDLQAALIAEGVDPDAATLVVFRLEDERVWTVNAARAAQRFVPASTSKIPHSLIAFETGAVAGPEEMFTWDGTSRWSPGWNETQSFGTAFKRSTVWIYQATTRRIGTASLEQWLGVFDYGNADTGGAANITTYWLSGPLEISANEQVAFLARLARRTLPLSASTYAKGISMMEADRGADWTLYAKTGWKSVPGERDYGWYVGWVEQTAGAEPGTYVFAFNMDFSNPDQDAPKRLAAAHRALRLLGALPPAA